MNEKQYGEYFGVSLPSMLELYHSEFNKHVEGNHAHRVVREFLLVPYIYQPFKDKINGYKYDPKTQQLNPYRYKHQVDFHENRIIQWRHCLSEQVIAF